MYLLFDLGATKTRVAVADSVEGLTNHEIFPTSHSFEEGIENIAQAAGRLARSTKIKYVVGGVGNPLDENKEFMANSFKNPFNDWVGKSIKKALSNKLNAPVYLENDSAMVGLGEAIYGPGKDHKIVAYITVSTGVGGARIVEGRIDHNYQGFEPGHQIIQIPDQKNRKFRLEELIGGESIHNETGQIPSDVKTPGFWEDKARKLAYGINNAIVFWSPEIVILGGSITNDIPIEIVEEELKKVLKVFKKIPLIRKGTLGDLGGLYGVLSYANNLKNVSHQ